MKKIFLQKTDNKFKSQKVRSLLYSISKGYEMTEFQLNLAYIAVNILGFLLIIFNCTQTAPKIVTREKTKHLKKSNTACFYPPIILKLLIIVQMWKQHDEENLRVRAFFHKTVRLCHVYCNFKIGCTCRITVIFGTLQDVSLLINTLVSNISFSYRNMFQNGVDAL